MLFFIDLLVCRRTLLPQTLTFVLQCKIGSEFVWCGSYNVVTHCQCYVFFCSGRKSKAKHQQSCYQAGSTMPFIPTNPAPGTTGGGYLGDPNRKKYPPIVRAAPINSGTNQPGSPAVGYGDLSGGAQNLTGPITSPRISATTGAERLVGATPAAGDQRSSTSSLSSIGRINHAAFSICPDPSAQTPRSPVPPTTAVSQQQASLTPSGSRMNGVALRAHHPPGYRVNAAAHSSLV